MAGILIKNGRVVDPAQGIDEVVSILIEKGKVIKIGKRISAKNVKEIDAKGKIVTPGWVDIHVHVREPGREDKETIKTFSRAAVKGGITSACCMPNVAPITDNQTVVEYIVSRVEKDSLMNIYPYGAITKGLKGEEFTEMWDMQKAGIVGVTDDGRDVLNLGLFKRALKYCKTLGLPVICHNENEDLSCDGVMHEGRISTYLGLPGNPASSESAAVAAQIVIAEEVDHPVHFTHLSSTASVEMVAYAKKKGIPVSADCTPHHLVLTDEACLDFDTSAKVNPPLRSEDHRKSLIKALKSGVIDCIATDHAPHTLVEKYVAFQDAAFGISGMETFVPLLMEHIYHQKVLSLTDLIAKVTCNPANVIGLNKGTLELGADADVTIIDENMKAMVDVGDFESKGKNTPFKGQEMRGWPVCTIVGGKIVMENGEIID